ncbi:MAG: ferrous iron transport protein B, partial [Victivallales bacterium]|nr:ferrous iron transport protein B [Victivallales bacterium]
MKRIAIAGNPNSGKTCLFNNMTGANQRVGNYPGVTVEFVTGETKLDKEKTQVIDLPGTYSLTAYSQEELVARDFIVNERPDVIINVVDASNLERNLYLTAQLIELNVPVVIALNMVDVADKKGISIDAKRLSEILGVEVVKTAANRGIGFDELKTACKKTIDEKILPKPISYSHELQSSFPELLDAVKDNAELCGHYPPKWTVIKLLEDDEQVLKQLELNKDRENIKKLLKQAKQHLFDHSHEDSATAVVESRYGFANGVCRDVSVMSEVAKQMLTDKIDRIVCNRFLGPIILCAIVYLMFTFTFSVAEDLTWIPLFNGEWVSPTGLFELIFEKFSDVAKAYIETPWLLSLVDEGIISGVGGVLGFVPLIFFMFMFIAVLEDTGYIARVAFILDRILRIFGLQGKSVLAMIVSGGFGAGGCAVPGVMATRTLREEKDRLVTIVVAQFMNCGAKMPVYAMLIAAFFAHSRGAMMFLLWLLSWAFALGSALILRKFVIKGEQTPFVMELPVYHLPTIRGVLMDTWNRTYMYIKK